MHIKVEVSTAELEAMGCHTIDEFKTRFESQLVDGVVTEAGRSGEDWLCSFTIAVQTDSKQRDDSPFKKHRGKVLGHYGTADWLRAVVMAMWNGNDNRVGLSKLTNLDREHFAAFTEMVSTYHRLGEADPAFMALAEEVKDRIADEARAADKEAEFREWLDDATDCLREQGKHADLATDRYTWFWGRFNAGDTPESAAASCPPYENIEEN
jgi:hypothetical protein